MKIFISYSHGIKNWIETLMNELKEKIKQKGLDIEFIWDKTHLKFGQDMNYFMENSIREADKVLIFCSSDYTEKANSRERGVGIETLIITPHVYSQAEQTKFIPVILWGNEVPDYLKSRYGIFIKTKEISEETLNIYINAFKFFLIEMNSKELITKKESTKIVHEDFVEKGKFPLTMNGILNEIFNSVPEDWEADKFREHFIYKYNIQLTIHELEETKREFHEPWAERHPDSRAFYYEYAIKYNNQTIKTIPLVAVDGYRAWLPLPNIKTGKIQEKYMRFANIINPVPEGINYEYVYRSKLEIEEN